MWIREDEQRPLMPWDLQRTPIEKHKGGEGHDQLSHGRWAAGRSGYREAEYAARVAERERRLSTMPVSETIAGRSSGDLQQEMLASGGISVTFTGKRPKSGFMVSHAGSEVVVSDADMRDPVKGKEIIRRFINENRSAISERRPSRRVVGSGLVAVQTGGPKNYFGAWFNGKTADNPDGDDNWYLDISENIDTLTDAVRVGRERRQLAIYSVNADDVINMDSPLADYAMSREGGNPEGSSWFSPGSGRRRPDEAMIDAFKAADMETAHG